MKEIDIDNDIDEENQNENDEDEKEVADKISNLVSKFKENTKKILEGEHSDPHKFAENIWEEFVSLFSEVNESLKTAGLTLKLATLREYLKNFNVLFNFMRKFGKIKEVSLKQFESIMDSIEDKDGSDIEKLAEEILNKFRTIEKNNIKINHSEKAPNITFQFAENTFITEINEEQKAFEFLSTNWWNFARRFIVGSNNFFDDRFESNPAWFGKFAKMIWEANGGQVNKNILKEIKIDDFENNEMGQEAKIIIDYKSGYIKDVLDFLRNAKKNCGYKESKAKADGEKEFAKKLFKWCDDVLEGYSKRRRAEIKEELDKNKKEKLKYIEDKEFKKKLEKEKDVYISEIQRHLHLAAKNFRKKDETGCYKHFRKAFDLLCLLAESEMTNNKSDKKGLKGWYTNAAKGVNKYNDKEIVKAIMKVTNYQNKGFLGFGKSRLTKIYKEILNLSNVFENLIN